MSHWPDRRILDLLGIELPILQAPMAGATGSAMAIAVGLAGGLGDLPCAMLSGEQVRAEIAAFRAGCPGRPLNLNFFCHQPPAPDAERDARWKQALEPYYSEVGADFAAPTPVSNRAPFDEQSCLLVEALRPEVVSFHFGLPQAELLQRVKASANLVLQFGDDYLWSEGSTFDDVLPDHSEQHVRVLSASYGYTIHGGYPDGHIWQAMLSNAQAIIPSLLLVGVMTSAAVYWTLFRNRRAPSVRRYG